MIFETLLVIVLTIVLLYASFQRRKAPAVAISALLLALSGLFFLRLREPPLITWRIWSVSDAVRISSFIVSS